jgi:hypothetical protein
LNRTDFRNPHRFGKVFLGFRHYQILPNTFRQYSRLRISYFYLFSPMQCEKSCFCSFWMKSNDKMLTKSILFRNRLKADEILPFLKTMFFKSEDLSKSVWEIAKLLKILLEIQNSEIYLVLFKNNSWIFMKCCQKRV